MASGIDKAPSRRAKRLLAAVQLNLIRAPGQKISKGIMSVRTNKSLLQAKGEHSGEKRTNKYRNLDRNSFPHHFIVFLYPLPPTPHILCTSFSLFNTIISGLTMENVVPCCCQPCPLPLLTRDCPSFLALITRLSSPSSCSMGC